MRFKQFILFAVVVACMVSSMHAATYYASPAGGGNGTSYSTPTSFSAGLKKLKNPGDTLYLLSGQYNLLTTDIANLNGTASKRIVISGYEGTNAQGSYDAILDFRKTAYGKRGLQIQNTCTYLHVKNLTLRYSGKNNLINYGSYNLFENLDIYGSSDTGCQMKDGGNNTIKNVDSHDNFDYELDKSGNLTLCDFGGNADGFADKQFMGAGNNYIGCRAWNNSDDGWDFYQRVSTSQTVFENCICYANGPATYDMRYHPRYETDKTWFDQFASGRTIIDADGVEVYATLAEYPNMGNGNGFKLGGNNTVHNVLVHHCLSVSNTVKGFDQNNDAGTVYLYNNTAYDNGTNYGFYSPNGCKLYIRNCIGLSGHTGNVLHKDIVQVNDHNSWNMDLSGTGNSFRSKDKALILAPRNADGSLPANDFLRLTDDSPLIDAGVNVGLPYSGAAPDLGWKEEDRGPAPEPDPQPSATNRIFYWQMKGMTPPANGATLTAEGGTIYAGTTDGTKAFGTELASYVAAVPEHMQATDGWALKMTSNALYLVLKPTSGSFLAGDTLYLCGYNVWKIATSRDNKDIIDSIFTGNSNTAYDIAHLVLPTKADSLVLSRNRGKGTGVSAIIICRGASDGQGDSTGVEVERERPSHPAHKFIRNGQLFLLRGDEIYTLQGQKIQ